MNSDKQSITVADAPDAGRFEARVDGQLAGFITYRQAGGTLVLVHTEVAPEFEGKGVGGQLAAGALELVRERGQKIRIKCQFLADYLGHHPEYGDLLAD
jgi:predicted GNAT family acetyltransferase